MKSFIRMPDGSVLGSGADASNAIVSLQFTQCVNSGTELNPGSVCANMVEVTVIAPHGGLKVEQGQELEVYWRKEDGSDHFLGLFTTEKPLRTGSHGLKFTAYDRAGRLERDITQSLSDLQNWPYKLKDLAKWVCSVCDLELVENDLPNGEYMVQKFQGENITGRMLLQWIGQLAGRFARITPEGKLEFAWYTPREELKIGGFSTAVLSEGTAARLWHPFLQVAHTPSGNVTVTGENMQCATDGVGNVTVALSGENQTLYRAKSLSYADYRVQPVARVQLKATREDVGTVWPADVTPAVNTYVVSDNPLIGAETGSALVPVAQTLYELLSPISYTPCQVKLPAQCMVQAGDIITLRDGNGVPVTAYVMQAVTTGKTTACSCTGSLYRQSISAINRTTLTALSGKVTQLRLDVEGLHLENRDQAGNLGKLSASLNGIQAQVESQQQNIAGLQTNVTQLRQDSGQLAITVSKIQTEGAAQVCTQRGYTFDDRGLFIRRTGSQMENRLDDTGMYVSRSGQVLLQANDAGVEAVDVTVKNYLVVGDHARFEDYAGGADTARTACFWI